MLSFREAQLTFTILLTISSILVVIVLGSYHRQGQNTLLRATCVVLLLMTLLLFFGNFYWNTELRTLPQLKSLLEDEASNPEKVMRNWEFPTTVGRVAAFQAISLNYLQITLHALLSCALVNSTCQALGWRIFGKGDTSGLRSRVFMCFAVFTPLFPCIYLLVKSKVTIYPLFFYYCVYSPQFLTRAGWIALFSLPGVGCGGYLFVRSMIIRHRTLKLTNTSQLSVWYMLRLGLALLMFIFLTVLGLLPLKEDIKLFDAFIPTLYGIVIFFMYGFGAPARKVYAEIFGLCGGERASFSSHSYPSISRSTFRRPSAGVGEDYFDRRASPIPVPEFPPSPYYVGEVSPSLPRRGSAPITESVTSPSGHLGRIGEDYRAEISSNPALFPPLSSSNRKPPKRGGSDVY